MQTLWQRHPIKPTPGLGAQSWFTAIRVGQVPREFVLSMHAGHVSGRDVLNA